VRRGALVGAVLLALTAAAPAAALLPPVPGSAVGDGVPLKAYASVTPTVHLFGDAVTARVAVVADTKWVDPARLRVRTDFQPYEPVQAPTVLRLGSGRFLQITWTWELRCLTATCVPTEPPSDKYHVFRFPPAHIDYLTTGGKRQYGITAAFPAVETLSQVSPGIVAYLAHHNALNWQFHLAPVASPAYRVSPALVFWLGIGLAATFAATGLLLAGRWALGFRKPALAATPTVSASTLERALALFSWAHEHGDETLERKALERVADELPVEVRDLSEAARALAWSPETPEDEDVQAISQRARLGAAPGEVTAPADHSEPGNGETRA
jgi:hypothetical protein